jgi:hypothetical protein
MPEHPPTPERPLSAELLAYKQRLTALIKDDEDMRVYTAVTDHATHLLRVYGNAARERNYFHLIVGSTMTSKYSDEDFSGEDSVRALIDTIVAQSGS